MEAPRPEAAVLPGKEMSFLLCPLDPAYTEAGIPGHLPATQSGSEADPFLVKLALKGGLPGDARTVTGSASSPPGIQPTCPWTAVSDPLLNKSWKSDLM